MHVTCRDCSSTFEWGRGRPPHRCQDCRKAPTHHDRCGTYSGYRRHGKRGERPCDDCKRANAARSREMYSPNVKLVKLEACVVCGGVLEGQKRVVCSAECRTKRLTASDAYKKWQAKRKDEKLYARKYYVRVCRHCGRSWETQNPEGQFCSIYCYGYDRRQFSIELYAGPPVAPRCELPKRHPARLPAQKHPRSWAKVFVQGDCPWCGEQFCRPGTSFGTRPQYCSPKCSRAAGKVRNGRFTIPAALRLSIYERDGWVCQLCDDPVDRDLHPSDPWAATLDHIECQSWGEPDHSPNNLRLAHRWCNSVRGDESYYTAEVLARGEEKAA